jgi:hypothetical protein
METKFYVKHLAKKKATGNPEAFVGDPRFELGTSAV